MTSITVYLQPHSTFRGRRLPRSDTLFGAFCWGWRLLFGSSALETLLGAFHEKSVPFLLSSMFDYTETSLGRIHYLPKPLSEPFLPDTTSARRMDLKALGALKRLKAWSRVCDEDFSKILHGEKSDQDFYDDLLQEEAEIMNLRRSTPQTLSIPHSSSNRFTQAFERDHFFYTNEVVVGNPLDNHRSGVFFCIKCQDTLVQEMKTVAYFLADKGIGGGVSSGKGQFKAVELLHELPYREPPDEESHHWITLSLTYPDTGLQKVLSKSWYTLERRQGKVESMYMASAPGNIWKDHLLMLQEGSTFPKNGQSFYGSNPIVRPAGDDLDFDIQQYGYAFTVNTKHVNQ